MFKPVRVNGQRHWGIRPLKTDEATLFAALPWSSEPGSPLEPTPDARAMPGFFLQEKQGPETMKESSLVETKRFA